MFVLNNITFEFGSRYLFRDVSWHIDPGVKTGLIGPNGSGKSTLLRVIAGEYSPSSGEITSQKGAIIGFLNQDLLSYESDRSIVEVAMEAFERQNELAKIIDDCLKKLETDSSDELLHELHDAQSEYAALDGYSCQHKAEMVLEGLGFKTEELSKSLKKFSGGWRMRVMLAKILLTQPDLLLLDEPTNHLDLPSIKWLEEYLESFKGALIVVSHDRYFLDSIADRIVEVRDESLQFYEGNYSYYLEEKQSRDELRKNQVKNQEKYIREQEKFINRFRAKASKAKAVQSRIKMLDKLEKISDLDDSVPVIKMKLDLAVQPGKVINKLNVKRKAYQDSVIFNDTGSLIERGDKIALIGANGTGKTTLLRMIAGIEPFEGVMEDGYNVVKSVFAQHQLESLNLKNSILEELQVMAPDETDNRLRTLLGAFLFKGDDVFKKIKVLSGGEKSRVALAKTMLTKANFLLLDEPTNHLDIQSVNTLIKVLNDYRGSFVVISHDRFFLGEVANKIWYIEDKTIKEYPGSYSEFEIWKESQDANETPVVKTVKVKTSDSPKNNVQDSQKVIKKLQSGISRLEDDIRSTEDQIKEKLEIMSNEEVYSDHEKLRVVQSEHDKLLSNLTELKKEWELNFNQLIELGNDE